MAKSPTLQDVIQRRKEITQTIADLQAEDADLEVAERALRRLSGTTLVVEGQRAEFRLGRKKPEKPESIPTVPEMIITSLEDAASRGLKGLAPRDMTDFINRKWWPEATIDNIGPIAWRMWKRNQLRKSAGKYGLPKSETPTGGPEGASRNTGEGDASPDEGYEDPFELR